MGPKTHDCFPQKKATLKTHREEGRVSDNGGSNGRDASISKGKVKSARNLQTPRGEAWTLLHIPQEEPALQTT